MSAPDIPTDYTTKITFAGGMGVDLDLDNIRIKEIAPTTVTTISRIEEIAPTTVTTISSLTSTSTVDMGLDEIRIKELPKIELSLQTSMKPTRVHVPVNLRFGLSSLGMELLAFCICGETMMIVEDYVPHKTELCG